MITESTNTDSRTIQRSWSVHEWARLHELPTTWEFVTREHPMGRLYRSAKYDEIGPGFLRWAEDFAYIQNPVTDKFEPLVWLNWQVTEILRVVRPHPENPRKFMYKTVMWIWPRRFGKTLVASLLDVWACDQFPNQVCIIAANSEDQASSTAFNTCHDTCKNSPRLFQKFARNGIQALNIVFPNGSEIGAVPRSIPSMYGKKLHIGQTTELCVAKNDDHYQVLASSTADVQGVVQVDSNFGATSNKVFELFDLAMTGQDESIGVSIISYKDIDEAVEHNLSPYISEQFLRSRALQMTSGEFKRNHLNHPAEGAENMFSEVQVEACRVAWEYPLSPAFIKDLCQKRFYWQMYGGGYDGAMAFSKRGDRTVWSYVLKGHLNEGTLLEEYPDQYGEVAEASADKTAVAGLREQIAAYAEPFEYVLIESDEIKGSSQDLAQKAIRHCTEKYGPPSNIVLEAFQAAALFQWCSQSNLPAELVSPTVNVQSAMFNLFYQIVAARRLKILSGQWLIVEELKIFQADDIRQQYGMNRKVKLKVDRKMSIDVERSKDTPEIVMVKDDSVYSAAHACYGLRDKQPVVVPRARVLSVRLW